MDASLTLRKETSRQRRNNTSARQARLAFWLLLPTMAVLCLVAIYPLIRTFNASLTNEVFARPDLAINYVGLANYQKLLSFQIVELPTGKRPVEVLSQGYYVLSRFPLAGRTMLLATTDPDFVRALVNTLLFTTLAVSTELVFGLGLALLMNSRFRGRGVMRSLMLIPWVIPTVVSAQLWKWMLFDSRAGVINDMLMRFGLITESFAWRAEPRLQLISAIMIDVWKATPYVALLLLAGLQIIPEDLYEAAAVDGATQWEQFLEITIPLLRPIILLTLIFRTLDALRVFDIFDVLLGHAVPSLATFNQDKLIGTNAYGYASAIGVVIFVLIFVFTILYMSVFRVDEA